MGARRTQGARILFRPRCSHCKCTNKGSAGELIRELPESNPALHRDYIANLRSFDAARLFLGESGRYPLTGRGRINTYAVFAELIRGALKAGGRAGIIVPSGIATDDTTKFFFQDLVQQKSLVSLFDFENRKKIFVAIDSRIKFALFTLRYPSGGETLPAEFAFFALKVEDLRRPEKRFPLQLTRLRFSTPILAIARYFVPGLMQNSLKQSIAACLLFGEKHQTTGPKTIHGG